MDEGGANFDASMIGHLSFDKHFPIICSDLPFPYISAVSKKLIPLSMQAV
jgi:hypothetical protein